MIKKMSLFLIIFILTSSCLYAKTTAVIRVTCIIPPAPTMNLSAAQESGQEFTTGNSQVIVQTEEKEEEESRIIIRTMVAK
jgi:hypothetical protein